MILGYGSISALTVVNHAQQINRKNQMKFNPFKPLDPIDVAKEELREAKLLLLKAQTAKEYAEAIVTYQSVKIKRLEEYTGLK